MNIPAVSPRGLNFKARSFKGRGLWRILHLPRTVKLTRMGKWYIALVLVTGAIAINTGNNLLYLVLATLLSLIIISGLMSEFTMKSIEIKRTLPKYIFKGSPFSLSLHIANKKKIIPSLCFRVYELQCKGLPDTHSYVVKVGSGEEFTSKLANTFTERGLIELRGFKITTTFPFGFFLKSKKLPAPQSILVYPAMPAPKEKNIINSRQSKRGLSTPRRGSGMELYNIRNYTQHDDARHIHWKSAARTGHLMVKEYEQESSKSLIVSFQNISTDGDSALFETKVDETAGMINYYLEEGWSVGLETLSGNIAEARGETHLHKILKFLALIKPAGKGIPYVKARRS